ncbi:MAG TPA: CopD family protein [Xanthomonadaceae bacterium]|nr:CopD family protein [Xanthomonadaceae bacterium]
MPLTDLLSGLDAWTLARIAAAALLYAGALLAAGGALFRLAFPRLPDIERRLVAGLGGVGAVLAIAMALAQWPLLAGDLGGGSLDAAFDVALLTMVVEGPQGTRLSLVVAGLLLLAAAHAFWKRTARVAVAVALTGTALVLLAFVQTGHTRGEPRVLLAGLLMLHLLAVAFWLAALAPLFRLAGRADAPAHVARILARFGRIGAAFVPVLLLAGVIVAWLLVGDWTTLVRTAYGQVLLGKVTLVGTLLLLAALNKWRLVPAMARGDPRAGPALRRSIVAEALLMSIILLITAALTTTTSPHG